MVPKTKTPNEIKVNLKSPFFTKEGGKFIIPESDEKYSLISTISNNRLTLKEQDELMYELNEKGFHLPDGKVPFGDVRSIVSDLLCIYNLDSNDQVKMIRAQETYERWRRRYSYYRNAVRCLKQMRIDPNCYYYIQYSNAEKFMYLILSKGLNLAGNVNSVKKAGRYKIDQAEHKEKTIIEITKPYVESLNWKTEIFTRLAGSIVVGGTVIATAQQEAIQKLTDVLPGLGHVVYVGSAVLTLAFFSFSKHLIRYLALSARNKAYAKKMKQVQLADKAETISGEIKAAIFRLSVMELMADLGYWNELKDVVHKEQEPLLYEAVKTKNADLFSDEILKAKTILGIGTVKWYKLRKKIILGRCKSARNVAQTALNSAREMNGIGLTSSEKSYVSTVEGIKEEVSHEVH